MQDGRRTWIDRPTSAAPWRQRAGTQQSQEWSDRLLSSDPSWLCSPPSGRAMVQAVVGVAAKAGVQQVKAGRAGGVCNSLTASRASSQAPPDPPLQALHPPPPPPPLPPSLHRRSLLALPVVALAAVSWCAVAVGHDLCAWQVPTSRPAWPCAGGGVPASGGIRSGERGRRGCRHQPTDSR